MYIQRDIFKIANERGCVLSIGNFDGVHLGHQTLLQELNKKAQQLKLPACVMLFEPHPKEFFMENPPARLMRCREKLAELKHFNIDNIFLPRFKENFANLTAQQFIEELLVKKLQVKHILVGADFHFGYQRAGNIETLKEAGKKYQFSVQIMSSFSLFGERVSSSKIREFLEAGNLEKASEYLGKPYNMTGHIVHGNKLGRVLGFPTANINLYRRKSPLTGIFVARVYGISEQPWPGVASLGIRPTVCGKKHLLEVYLFDFDKDIYGRLVKVEFLQKLRDEEYYDSLDKLKEQIAKDVELARSYFLDKYSK